MHTPGAGLLPDHRAYTVDQLRIPGGSQRDPYRISRRGTIVSDPDRPIRHFERRQAKPFIAANVKRILAADHVDLFFHGHLAENRIDFLLDLGLGGCRGLRKNIGCKQQHDYE